MTERCAYIVDDDQALRRVIDRILTNMQVRVQEFATAEAFLKGYVERPPGCVLLDVRLPGMDGLELLDRIGKLVPVNPVIMVSGHGDVPSAVRAVKAGALDFLQKPFSQEDLIEIVQRALEKIEGQESWAGQMQSLTPREREVLDAFADGAPNKIVAARLHLSPRTVEMHRARIFKKLGVSNLSQALFRARRSELEIGS